MVRRGIYISGDPETVTLMRALVRFPSRCGRRPSMSFTKKKPDSAVPRLSGIDDHCVTVGRLAILELLGR